MRGFGGEGLLCFDRKLGEGGLMGLFSVFSGNHFGAVVLGLWGPPRLEMTRVGGGVGSVVMLGCPNVGFVNCLHYDHPYWAC